MNLRKWRSAQVSVKLRSGLTKNGLSRKTSGLWSERIKQRGAIPSDMVGTLGRFVGMTLPGGLSARKNRVRKTKTVRRVRWLQYAKQFVPTTPSACSSANAPESASLGTRV